MERRRFYRLRYPDEARPEDGVLLDGRMRPLVELSECGVRFETDPDTDAPEVGSEVELEVRLPDGRNFTIGSATIIRVQGHEVVLVFDHGIPSDAVFSEQRRLIRRARGLGDAGALAALRPPYMSNAG